MAYNFVSHKPTTIAITSWEFVTQSFPSTGGPKQNPGSEKFKDDREMEQL